MNNSLTQFFKDPKYKKLWERLIDLKEDLRYPNSEGSVDEIRNIQRFEEWLSKNKY